MPAPSESHTNAASDEGWLSRERALALTLVVATVIVFYLCYRLVAPFLPALAFALALAIAAYPIHRFIHRRIPYENLAAGVSVLLVTVIIIAPAVFVTQNLVAQAAKYSAQMQQQMQSGNWRKTMDEHPRLKAALPWVETQLGLPPESVSGAESDESESEESADLTGEGNDQRAPATRPSPSRSQLTQRAATAAPDRSPAPPPSSGGRGSAASFLTQGLSSLLTGTVWFVFQLFITLLTLFFFFRDRQQVLDAVRSVMPLNHREIEEVFTRVDDTIHATIYGSLLVAMVQGFMGGLMFWWLGLPAPLLWGAIMGFLATVPVLGTFVVWAPAALYLGLQGNWGKALILAGWGAIAISTIDNVLYPFIVGKRMRFHTLIVFLAITGGLAVFGASGVILGPLLVALADALLEIWRRRTAFGGTLEEGLETTQ